jgi:putative endonuclease
MKIFTSKSQKIGKLGEDIACKYLVKNGFTILERNYTKKWGEIDVIAQRNNTIHFIEVKATAQSRRGKNEENSIEVNKGQAENFFRPEENVHPWKRRRLRRIIETYLIHKRIGNTPWQFDIFLIFIDSDKNKAHVERMDNIVL